MITVSPYVELTVYNPRPGLRTAAEIRRQKIRRQEGAAFDAIFLLLLLGSHRRSPRRRSRSRRGRRSLPRAARALGGGSGRRGQPLLLPDTPPPPRCGRRTFGSALHVTFRHAGANSCALLCTLALGPLGCFSSRDGDPSLLLGRHLSNSERCTWFFFFFFSPRSVIPLFLE